MLKLKRITKAIIKTFATATVMMVLPVTGYSLVKAPRMTADATCLTAKKGHEREVASIQRDIQNLRDHGEHERAQHLQAYMERELMVEKWREVKENLVVTAGLNDILDKYFAGSSYTAAWFLGLISSVSYSAIAAGDTMSSHAGWTEAGATNAPNYSSSTRPAISFSAASGGSKASSSAVSFTFTAGGTIKGCFTASNSTKDGTTGILYNAVLFTGGDRVVANTDVVNVSLTYSAA